MSDTPECEFCIGAEVKYEQRPAPGGPTTKAVCQGCGEVIEEDGFYGQKA